MNLPRFVLPLFLVLALLAAQQAGAAHAIGHALEHSEQDQHTAHSAACEKCASYAQLGSALKVGAFDLALITLSGAAPSQFTALAAPFHAFAAAARGPPAVL